MLSVCIAAMETLTLVLLIKNLPLPWNFLFQGELCHILCQNYDSLLSPSYSFYISLKAYLPALKEWLEIYITSNNYIMD